MFGVLHCVNTFSVFTYHVKVGRSNIKTFPEDINMNHCYGRGKKITLKKKKRPQKTHHQHILLCEELRVLKTYSQIPTAHSLPLTLQLNTVKG